MSTENDHRHIREGLGLLIKHYEKLGKSASVVGNLHMAAEAEAQIREIVTLRSQYAGPQAPSDQIEAFPEKEPEEPPTEPDLRPLHLRVNERGFKITAHEVEEAWTDLDRENVRDWLDRRLVTNPQAAPPAILVGRQAAN